MIFIKHLALTNVSTAPGLLTRILLMVWKTSNTCSCLTRSRQEAMAQNVPLRPTPLLEKGTYASTEIEIALQVRVLWLWWFSGLDTDFNYTSTCIGQLLDCFPTSVEIFVPPLSNTALSEDQLGYICSPMLRFADGKHGDESSKKKEWWDTTNRG